jgi:hypothetical protein
MTAALGGFGSLERFQTRTPVAQDRGAVGIAELRALADIDDVLAPDELGEPTPALDFGAANSADLRLPQPPLRAATGDALFRSLSSFVAKLETRERSASKEELKMGAVLRGIHELETEIRALMSKSSRV